MRNRMKCKVDYSTLNLDALRKFPTWSSAANHLDGGMGAGCAGDPPGFPSYFLRSVYNARGDSPTTPPYYCITYEGTHYAIPQGKDGTVSAAALRRLYRPLPIEHPRVQAWMLDKYVHHARCYFDADGTVQPWEHGRPSFVIYPVSSYKLRTFRDDPRFSNEWRTEERASIEQENDAILKATAELATPDNHMAVRYIREFYPEHAPQLDWIENPPRRTGDWWEVSAERPMPADCPGPFFQEHRADHCQFCGCQDGELLPLPLKERAALVLPEGQTVTPSKPLTPDEKLLAQLPAPDAGAPFRLAKVENVWMPHAYGIGEKHLAAADSGILDQAAIERAERQGARCFICKGKMTEHHQEKALYIVVPQNKDVNAVPGLVEYLNKIKATAEGLGITGFAFPTAEQVA